MFPNISKAESRETGFFLFLGTVKYAGLCFLLHDFPGCFGGVPLVSDFFYVKRGMFEKGSPKNRHNPNKQISSRKKKRSLAL